MKEFEVYFELYGKKMKTTVSAYNETGAKKMVQEKIIFHKVVEKLDDNKDIKDFMGDDDAFNRIMDIFGMGDKK